MFLAATWTSPQRLDQAALGNKQAPQSDGRGRAHSAVCATCGHPLLPLQGWFGWGSRGHPSRPSSGLPALGLRVTHLTLLLLMGNPPTSSGSSSFNSTAL